MVTLKSECLSLKLIDVEDIDLACVICFSDASFAKRTGNYLQIKYILFLHKYKNYFLQLREFTQRVLKSTFATESLAFEQASFIIISCICETFNR